MINLDFNRQLTVLQVLSKLDEPERLKVILNALHSIGEDTVYIDYDSFTVNSCLALNRLYKKNLIDVLILPIPPKYKKTRKYYAINALGIELLAKSNIREKLKTQLLQTVF